MAEWEEGGDRGQSEAERRQSETAPDPVAEKSTLASDKIKREGVLADRGRHAGKKEGLEDEDTRPPGRRYGTVCSGQQRDGFH